MTMPLATGKKATLSGRALKAVLYVGFRLFKAFGWTYLIVSKVVKCVHYKATAAPL